MLWGYPYGMVAKGRQIGLWALLLACWLCVSGLLAQKAPAGKPENPLSAVTQAPAEAQPPDPLGRSSPHGCVVGFLLAARKPGLCPRGSISRYREARKGSPRSLRGSYRPCLMQGLTGNLDELSRENNGKRKKTCLSGLARFGWNGRGQTGHGTLEIEVERVQRRGEAPIWLFSSDTLEQIPRVSEELNQPSFEQKFPRWMVETRLFSVPIGRWLVVVVAIVVMLAIAGLLSRLLQWLLGPLLGKILTVRDESVIRKLRAPLFILLLSATIQFSSRYSMTLLARQFWNGCAVILLVVGVTWLLIRVIDLAAVYLTQGPGGSVVVARATFVGVTVRAFKITAVLFACLTLLSRAGVRC